MLSFHPNISNYTPKVERSLDVSTWDALHRQTTKAKQGTRDLDQDEIELGREKGEYTFQPNPHKYQTQ